MKKLALLASACALVTSVASAQSGSTTVLGTDNIYAAGGNLLAPLSGGSGTVPAGIAINAGTNRILTLTSAATGTWTCQVGGIMSGPDGGNCVNTITDINALNKISGYRATNTMTLVGVFLGASLPASAPVRLDYTTAGAENACSYSSFQLGQVFFIGDGRGGTNCTQQFFVPDAASRFYFGIADAFGFVGDPSAYDDNSGQVSVTYNFSPSTTTPEPSTVALLAAGLAAVAIASRRRRA